MKSTYDDKLRKEIEKDIETFNKTGKLPRDYDVRRIRIKQTKSKKKEKLKYGSQIVEPGSEQISSD